MIKNDVQMIPHEDENLESSRVVDLQPVAKEQMASSQGFSEKSKMNAVLSTVKGPAMFKRDKNRTSKIKGT